MLNFSSCSRYDHVTMNPPQVVSLPITRLFSHYIPSSINASLQVLTTYSYILNRQIGPDIFSTIAM